MLDIVGLPKNVNGIRTTHTCELCGFEPKTKNKYREKQDHLVMKHFKEKIDKIFPHCRPYCCPTGDCGFTGKDKQALLRHYTGKHGILEKYLREALAAKGITYSSEAIKRKHNTGASESRGGTTKKLSPPAGRTGGIISAPQNQLQFDPSRTFPATTTTTTTNHQHSQNVQPRVNNAEELRKEVEAMMASFQPIDSQFVVSLPQLTINGQLVQTQQQQQLSQQLAQQQEKLPSFAEQPIILPASVISASNQQNDGEFILSTSPPKPLKTEPSDIVASSSDIVPSPSKTPLPSIRTIVSSLPMAVLSGTQIIATTASNTPIIASSVPQCQGAEVMWGTGATAGPTPDTGVSYIDSIESNTYTATTIDNIDEYLYSNAVHTSEIRERQLDFCML